MKPSEYEWMKPNDFVMWVHGYNERIVEQHHIARRQAYFSAPVEFMSKVSWQKFVRDYWPLPNEQEEQQGKTKRLLERLKQEKEKLNGNGKT